MIIFINLKRKRNQIEYKQCITCFFVFEILRLYLNILDQKRQYIYILGPYRIIITILADLLNKQNGVDIGNCRYSCGSL